MANKLYYSENSRRSEEGWNLAIEGQFLILYGPNDSAYKSIIGNFLYIQKQITEIIYEIAHSFNSLAKKEQVLDNSKKAFNVFYDNTSHKFESEDIMFHANDKVIDTEEHSIEIKNFLNDNIKVLKKFLEIK